MEQVELRCDLDARLGREALELGAKLFGGGLRFA
jgi:hypothetical protein